MHQSEQLTLWVLHRYQSKWLLVIVLYIQTVLYMTISGFESLSLFCIIVALYYK